MSVHELSKIEESKVEAARSAAVAHLSPDELNLEEMIHIANQIGLQYVEKRKHAERYELLRTPIRAKIMNRIEAEWSGKIPESRLKRLAEADQEYIDLLEQIASSRAESEALRIRYESYRNLFEAKRTLISYKKTELRAY